VNTVSASFNTITGHMTEMSQRKKSSQQNIQIPWIKISVGSWSGHLFIARRHYWKVGVWVQHTVLLAVLASSLKWRSIKMLNYLQEGWITLAVAPFSSKASLQNSLVRDIGEPELLPVESRCIFSAGNIWIRLWESHRSACGRR